MKTYITWVLSFTLIFALFAETRAFGVPSQNTNEKPAAFEVVSIELIVPNSGPPRPGFSMNAGPGCSLTGIQIDERRLTFTAPLLILVAMAQGGTCRVPEMITGVSDWMRNHRWDIEAILPAGTPKYTPTQFVNRIPEINAMLRTMIADRFKVVVHKEPKDATVTALTVGNGGQQLTKARDKDPVTRRINRRTDPDGKQFFELIAGKATMVALADMLQTATNRQVRDRTGLQGEFNIKFEYDNDGITRSTIFSALQQELGLKLEPSKEDVEAIVIDRAEKPTGN
jgi:uncharacterized protein (TIGR03435 family)